MKPNGYIIYRGPSALDGAPIVVIVTGTATRSANAKTGDMLQTWILREDVAPHIAIKTGEDASICGNCPHRGEHDGTRWTKTRTCYVQTHNAPLSVWKAYKRGNYPLARSQADRAAIGEGFAVRVGSYGDPYAVPFSVWQAFLSRAKSWTGYTHQWREASGYWSKYLMASVDNDSERQLAESYGWRTFRVMSTGATFDKKAEVLCPASVEAGNKSSCAMCTLCNGSTSKARKSVAIYVHGSGAAAFSRAA
jgi:hypothetical protein